MTSLLETLRTMRSKPSEKSAHFVLRYTPPGESSLPVGHLEFEGGTWIFRYDEAFKERSDLRPIEGFDEIDKVYRSSVLFPFFAIRIPDADREDVKRALALHHIRRPALVDLLRLFGRRVVSSPAFELVPV